MKAMSNKGIKQHTSVLYLYICEKKSRCEKETSRIHGGYLPPALEGGSKTGQTRPRSYVAGPQQHSVGAVMLECTTGVSYYKTTWTLKSQPSAQLFRGERKSLN